MTRVAAVSGVVDANLTRTTWRVVNSATEPISLTPETKAECRQEEEDEALHFGCLVLVCVLEWEGTPKTWQTRGSVSQFSF